MQTVESAIKSRVYGHGRGWVFTPKHFVDLGSSESIRLALFTLNKEEVIRRLFRGVYDYPRQHKTLGFLLPCPEDVASALAAKNGFRVQPAGAYAANAIGLSEQVPGKAVFLTDGPSKTFKIKNLEVHLKHTALNNMYASGSREALVIQAFKFMKQENIDKHMLEATKKILKESTRKDFEKNLRHAPEWIRKILFTLMESEL